MLCFAIVHAQCTHLGPLVAYNPVSLTGTCKTRFCRWWLWIMFTEAFIHGGIFDVHTSHDSLFDSFFTCHGTLKRKRENKVSGIRWICVSEHLMLETPASCISRRLIVFSMGQLRRVFFYLNGQRKNLLVKKHWN